MISVDVMMAVAHHIFLFLFLSLKESLIKAVSMAFRLSGICFLVSSSLGSSIHKYFFFFVFSFSCEWVKAISVTDFSRSTLSWPEFLCILSGLACNHFVRSGQFLRNASCDGSVYLKPLSSISALNKRSFSSVFLISLMISVFD